MRCTTEVEGYHDQGPEEEIACGTLCECVNTEVLDEDENVIEICLAIDNCHDYTVYDWSAPGDSCEEETP